jgi:hypothetical protein
MYTPNKQWTHVGHLRIATLNKHVKLASYLTSWASDNKISHSTTAGFYLELYFPFLFMAHICLTFLERSKRFSVISEEADRRQLGKKGLLPGG